MSAVKGIFGVAAAVLIAASGSATAQDASTQIGNTTVTVGVGTAILTLPDVPSLLLGGDNGAPNVLRQTFKISDDIDDEIGWNVNGAIEVPVGAAMSVSLGGFWANIEDENSSRCTAAGIGQRCVVAPIANDNPAILSLGGFAGVNATSVAERDVDFWGVSLEAKRQMTPGVMGVTKAPPRRYLALGVDARGIDQDITETIRQVNLAGLNATYTEDLDTRYYGAYLAWGGDYTPFLFKGLWQRWGLQSSFRLQGGIYHADTDYEGRLSAVSAGGNPTSALSLSDDDVAFIGGLKLETSKRIGSRAVLSLKSEYEYYSYVPEMAYNQQDRVGAATVFANGQNGTVIDDDDAFSARTSLRLTIGLGPRDLYQEPLK